ncbi:MAG: transcription factor S [Candidatus Woesearchaeota archaeon]
MVFCPKCGGITVPKKVKNKKVIQCTSCGYIEKDTSKVAINTTSDINTDIPIVDTQHDMDALPQIKISCEKCGHTKGRYWVVQTRSSDEAPTKFVKCEKCAHTWREYD